MGVGLLLNGAYVILEQDLGFSRVPYVYTYLGVTGVMYAGVTSRCVTLAASPGVTLCYVAASLGVRYVGQKCNQPCLLGCAASGYLMCYVYLLLAGVHKYCQYLRTP